MFGKAAQFLGLSRKVNARGAKPVPGGGIEPLTHFEIFFKNLLTKPSACGIIMSFERTTHAGVAELADAQDSGSCGGNFMKVQVLSPALFLFLRTNRDLNGSVVNDNPVGCQSRP